MLMTHNSTTYSSLIGCCDLLLLLPLCATLVVCVLYQMMATSVVLATLSILPYERALFGRTDDLSHEQEKERTIRMATILGFTVVSATPAVCPDCLCYEASSCHCHS